MSDLASQLAEYLFPVLPYLLQGAKWAGQKAAETLGEETVKALWAKLEPHDGVQRAAQTALELSNNPAMEQVLAEEIRKVLQVNPALREQLAAILARAGVVGPKGDRSITVHGNVSGSILNTGDGNTIIKG